MATGSGIWASLGASLETLTSTLTSALLKLSASLQTYLDTAADRLSVTTEYFQSTTGFSPTVLYTTLVAILLLGIIPAVAARNGQGNTKPGIMRRYGFSTRGTLSPFGSTLGQGGVPDVTDEDYSYITSADLEDHGVDIPRQYRPHSHFVESQDYSRSAPPPAFARNRPEDDVMLIKHNGITYPEHFPAYSIGDGKLLVGDVKERIIMILDLSERQAKRVKLFYKGRRLKDPDAPVREYGVKNNSEVLMTLADSAGSSDSGEEVVVVGRDERDRYNLQPEREPIRTGRPGRWEDRGPRSPRSPRDSVPGNLGIPADDGKRRAASRVRTQSPSGSGVGSTVSAASAPPTVPVPVGKPGGPIEKLNKIADHFNTKLRPMCADFIARPPLDSKKRTEEHLKLSETIMHHVLLKLDEVDTSTEEGARARRKDLVRQVQAVLKEIDEAKA